jgi:SAM-dependent methyltransferase
MTSLYDELTPWYRLLDPTEDHEEEMLAYVDALAGAGVRSGDLLELGSGAGNNAHYLSRRFACTLADLSPAMLALSRELNPRCEHLEGDMRSLRLGRTFDAVVIHDAICHLTSQRDLQLALQTAFAHLRPGGAAIFAPDCLRETFVEEVSQHETSDAGRTLCCLEWVWDPDPADETCRAEYGLLLRENGRVRSVHVSEDEGLFSRAQWLAQIRAAGFEPSTFARPIEIAATEPGEPAASPYTDEVFLALRRA